MHAHEGVVPCRPANSALVTAASSGIELPASLQDNAEAVSEQFYLATMREPNAAQPMASMQRRGSVGSNCWQEEQNQGMPAAQSSLTDPEPFTAVNLGPLLGSGGSGHVYRGTWNGATVAVKVSGQWTVQLASIVGPDFAHSPGPRLTCIVTHCVLYLL